MIHDDRMVLALDVGNSRIKIVACENDRDPDIHNWRPVLEKVVGADDPKALMHFIAPLPLRGAVMGVTGVDVPLLEEVLEQRFGNRFLRVTQFTPFPIRIEYATPLTLGIDRIAAAVAAQRNYPGKPIIVVDAGTALTIDVVSPAGTYLGGNITPGLQMRVRSLHQYTARLPKVDLWGELPLWGHDTATAIRCGAVNGAMAEIDTMRQTAMCLWDQPCELMVTGGDAKFFNPRQLPHGYTSDDLLVAKGLICIYEHNEHHE